MTRGQTRHILSLSGGKDSTALAVYLRDRIPDLEYVFCDTEKELPETYEYLDRVEAYLGKPIVRLKHDGRGFDHWLVLKRGYLPSPRMRWCTSQLKIRPYKRVMWAKTESLVILGYEPTRIDKAISRTSPTSHRSTP